jgi:hypothetical protein
MADLTNFSIGQGESFKFLLELVNLTSGSVPLDITDYTFQGQVRENYTTDDIAASFIITKLSPYTSGSIFVQLTPAQTLEFDQRKYVYDINMVSGSVDTRRILEGTFTIRPAATK